jgi:hypothetical protein
MRLTFRSGSCLDRASFAYTATAVVERRLGRARPLAPVHVLQPDDVVELRRRHLEHVARLHPLRLDGVGGAELQVHLAWCSYRMTIRSSAFTASPRA